MGEARLWQSRLWSKSGIPLGNPIRNPANQRTSFPRIALSFCFTFHLSPSPLLCFPQYSVRSTQHPLFSFSFSLHSFTLHSFTLHSFTPSPFTPSPFTPSLLHSFTPS